MNRIKLNTNLPNRTIHLTFLRQILIKSGGGGNLFSFPHQFATFGDVIMVMWRAVFLFHLTDGHQSFVVEFDVVQVVGVDHIEYPILLINRQQQQQQSTLCLHDRSFLTITCWDHHYKWNLNLIFLHKQFCSTRSGYFNFWYYQSNKAFHRTQSRPSYFGRKPIM